LNRRIIYPEVISPGENRARPSISAKRGPLGALTRFLGGVLFIGVSIIAAALLGTVLFFVLAGLFLAGCVIGLGMMWRFRKLGRKGWPASGAYVFSRRSDDGGAQIIERIEIIRDEGDPGAPKA
jgi:amino acid transporter